jgi:hypothetical protein
MSPTYFENVDRLSFHLYFPSMSSAEIISEIPKLSHEARREIMRRIIDVEQDAVTLAECDQRALDRFQLLDRMEAENEKNAAR